jgi:hypothetical protein
MPLLSTVLYVYMPSQYAILRACSTRQVSARGRGGGSLWLPPRPSVRLASVPRGRIGMLAHRQAPGFPYAQTARPTRMRAPNDSQPGPHYPHGAHHRSFLSARLCYTGGSLWVSSVQGRRRSGALLFRRVYAHPYFFCTRGDPRQARGADPSRIQDLRPTEGATHATGGHTRPPRRALGIRHRPPMFPGFDIIAVSFTHTVSFQETACPSRS